MIYDGQVLLGGSFYCWPAGIRRRLGSADNEADGNAYCPEQAACSRREELAAGNWLRLVNSASRALSTALDTGQRRDVIAS